MREHCALWLARGARRVEDHRGVFFADLGRRCRGGVIQQRGELRSAAVVDGNPMLEINYLACIRHAVGMGCFVDQKPGAAVVEHIGNLGPAIEAAIEGYATDVRSRAFPGPEHVYDMKKN